MFQMLWVSLFSLVGEFSWWVKLKCSRVFKKYSMQVGDWIKIRRGLIWTTWFDLCLLKFYVKKKICLYRNLLNFDILKFWQTRFHQSITFVQFQFWCDYWELEADDEMWNFFVVRRQCFRVDSFWYCNNF